MRYYLDTEFDGFGGHLISLALVDERGCSIYLVLDNHAGDPWVRENVLPILWDCPLGDHEIATREHAAKVVADFLSIDSDPVIVTDWPADIRYFCDLIEFPGGNMAPIPGLKFELRRVDAYPTTVSGAVQHNAWWDAIALRELFEPGCSSAKPAVVESSRDEQHDAILGEQADG
jgi:hypothetical protein